MFMYLSSSLYTLHLQQMASKIAEVVILFFFCQRGFFIGHIGFDFQALFSELLEFLLIFSLSIISLCIRKCFVCWLHIAIYLYLYCSTFGGQ